MSNPIIIETDLKDILVKLDARLERVETKLEVLTKIEAEVTQLKGDVKGIKTKLEVFLLLVQPLQLLSGSVFSLKPRFYTIQAVCLCYSKL